MLKSYKHNVGQKKKTTILLVHTVYFYLYKVQTQKKLIYGVIAQNSG